MKWLEFVKQGEVFGTISCLNKKCHAIVTTKSASSSLDYLSETCKFSYKFPNYGIQKKNLVPKQFLNLLETLCFPIGWTMICPGFMTQVWVIGSHNTDPSVWLPGFALSSLVLVLSIYMLVLLCSCSCFPLTSCTH